MDDKSITIHGITVVRTSEPKINELSTEKPKDPKYIFV